MIAGSMRYKVDLYTPYGENNNKSYQYYKTVKAQLNFKNGSQILQSYQIFNTKSISIKIRFRKDVSEDMLVKIGDEFYDISCIQAVAGFRHDLIIDLVKSQKMD